MTPLASIIIPAYDVVDTIEEVVNAALDQSVPSARVEVIVVDNNSTDGTGDVVKRLPVRHVFEPRRNRSRARNAGAKVATGEFLAFLDADCVVPRHWLESLLDSLDAPWIGAAQARVQHHGREPPPAEFRQGHYFIPYLDSCTLLVRRNAFDAATGFNERLNRAVDMDFSFRVLSCGFAFSWVPDTIVIKHHDLSPAQAARRGWVGGQNLFRLDRAWSHLVRRSQGRLLWDRVKLAGQWVARDIAHHRDRAAATGAEQVVKLISYSCAIGTDEGLPAVSLPVVTTAPSIIGNDRYLVVDGHVMLVFDAAGRTLTRLSELETLALRELLDASSGTAPARGSPEGVDPTSASAALTRVRRLFGHD